MFIKDSKLLLGVTVSVNDYLHMKYMTCIFLATSPKVYPAPWQSVIGSSLPVTQMIKNGIKMDGLMEFTLIQYKPETLT